MNGLTNITSGRWSWKQVVAGLAVAGSLMGNGPVAQAGDDSGIETAPVAGAAPDAKAARWDGGLLSVVGQQVKSAFTGTSAEASTVGVNPDDVQGPQETAVDRLNLAMTNLGHLANRLVPLETETKSAPPADLGTSKVIGSDSRVQVTANTSSPWRAICHLSIKWPNGSGASGSGFFISQRTVLTAAHCVYNPGAGGWASSITVTAGRSGSSKPYGYVTVGSSSLYSVSGYTQSGQKGEYDYAAIVLPSTTPGATTGYFGYWNMSSADYSGKTFNVAGYPGDKTAGTMWYAYGPIIGTTSTVTNSSGQVTAGQVRHTIDTEGGQSGSPIWYTSGSSRYVVGIHRAGTSTENYGTRMASSLVSFIQARP